VGIDNVIDSGENSMPHNDSSAITSARHDINQQLSTEIKAFKHSIKELAAVMPNKLSGPTNEAFGTATDNEVAAAKTLSNAMDCIINKHHIPNATFDISPNDGNPVNPDTTKAGVQLKLELLKEYANQANAEVKTKSTQHPSLPISDAPPHESGSSSLPKYVVKSAGQGHS
jgi:hypothetical protein